METRKDRMAHPYIPQIDDYVVWRRTGGKTDSGWVYFVDEEYITIETGVKDKPCCKYTREEFHKKVHTLVVCHPRFYHQLEYIKNRRPDEPIRHQVEYNI